MARPGITKHEVFEAADQLVNLGKEPTIEQVRQLLKTGSNSTIGGHLRDWRKLQSDTKLVSINEGLPQDMVTMMKGLWNSLKAQAEQRLVAIEATHQQAMAELQHEVQKYKTNNQRWQQMFNQWQQEKEAFVREKEVAGQTTKVLLDEKVILELKLEAQHKQLEEKQERVEELNRFYKQAQANLEHFRESVRDQRLIEEEKHAKQLQQAESTLRNVEQRLAIEIQQNNGLKNQLEKVTDDMSHLQKTNHEMNQQSENLKLLHAKLEQENNDLKNHLTLSKNQNDLLQDKCIDLQTQLAVASKQLTSTIHEMNYLKDQNKLLVQEKLEIVQEKSRIEGINMQMQKMMQLDEVR